MSGDSCAVVPSSHKTVGACSVRAHAIAAQPSRSCTRHDSRAPRPDLSFSEYAHLCKQALVVVVRRRALPAVPGDGGVGGRQASLLPGRGVSQVSLCTGRAGQAKTEKDVTPRRHSAARKIPGKPHPHTRISSFGASGARSTLDVAVCCRTYHCCAYCPLRTIAPLLHTVGVQMSVGDRWPRSVREPVGPRRAASRNAALLHTGNTEHAWRTRQWSPTP